MLFGLFKKKVELAEVEIIEPKEERVEVDVVHNQRIIMFKDNGKSYTDGYVHQIYDKYFVVRRLDGQESLVSKFNLGDCDLLTINNIPVIIDNSLKQIINKKVVKELYGIEE